LDQTKITTKKKNILIPFSLSHRFWKITTKLTKQD